ncbi:Six-hairpin glycosidase [Suhomyces tanzawaensis NRRL Y-17324]|uniref:Mannosyl-oligosaccharide glucosidase n=1 Tax=Suhomyces tanzawaensis NRRL Y-17324 TaxID=984487 RepID=A0A1E4SM39_9ASCO|nr:Six-hairpin glycosidase [Suhomyces tanzawaensis NRRL Y-17324]ODV80477.1 Six-hairpin glycosidase [Suhomyces tanzawaensis NRRL Y-17324]
MPTKLTKEEERLQIYRFRRWGPYLGERQWATVREDYSHDGDAWSDFPFEHSRSRTYRWGEDGLAGVSDNRQFVCMSMALWNEKDDILKEKAFGLTNSQGNHGEDVKDLYYYLDNTPSHSYMKYLYKYPQGKFPYQQLVDENAKRTRLEDEYEITDTDMFKDNKYFDVVFEMAKGDDEPEELYFRITAYNRSKEVAPLHILPHLVLRNTWAWGSEESKISKPKVSQHDDFTVKVEHEKFGTKYFVFAPAPGATENSPDVKPKLLFTENETNTKRLYDQPNKHKYVKDAFHDYVIDHDEEAVNPEKFGTKTAAWFAFDENGGVQPGDYVTLRYKFSKSPEEIDEYEFDQVFARRQDEADAFYWKVSPLPMSDELRQVQRQSFAGLLWTKQFYNFVHHYWSGGDPNTPKPPENRANGRNEDWKHLYINDVLSLPDKWEYPFFAAWDTAFHCVPFAMIDPYFAKNQIDLLLREWYQHPNGQIPAYEWNFSDVNPPVHAWSAYRIFKIERKMYGKEDIDFLERVFHKLLLNFSWWVNRKDANGNNVFEGGFLGLDNIGVFNRSEQLPTGGHLEQADSTGWMAFFCLQMLNISLELAKTRPVYENIASKFFEHFILISDAMSYRGAREGETGETESSLWDEKDQFYYDAISYGKGHSQSLPVRSLVGLIPLYASLTLEPEILERFPGFKKRVDWFINNVKPIAERNIASMETRGVGERLLLALVNKDRLLAILDKMLNEDEFLSPYGIRSLSKYHKDHPFEMEVNGEKYFVGYLPGESDSGMFGGNSNWRGPIWFPVNFLLVEALQRFYLYYGPELKVECPKGSGDYLNLAQCAQEIQHRLMHLFIPDEDGIRACNGPNEMVNKDPYFKDYVPFYEYFDADTGRGLGASHQCGWTAVVAKWIHDNGVSCRIPKTPRTPRTPRSSVFLHNSTHPKQFDEEEEDSNEKIKQYYPKSGPFPGRLQRRKSGKSLLNLTVNALDLDYDESTHHSNVSAARRTSDYGKGTSLKDELEELVPTNSRGSIDSNAAVDDELLSQIKSAFQKYKLKEDEDPNDVSGDEFETRHRD